MKTKQTPNLAAALTVGIYATVALTAEGFTPQSWNFGSGEGRDGDGGFALSVVGNDPEGDLGEWNVTSDAIRFTAPDEYNDYSALLPINELGGTTLQDFTITLTGTITSISGDSWAFRGGAVALGEGALGTDYGTTDHYVASLHRIQSSERRFRIAAGAGGSVLASVTPDTLSSGVGFTVRLEGSYDQDGVLSMLASTWYDNDTETIWTAGPYTNPDPMSGIYFGIGGRARSGTEVDFHSLAIVPEPATYALFGGLLALGLVLVRRRFARNNPGDN